MGSFLGSAVFSASAFFYCLGLIFAVVGYIGAWLEPREGGNLAIQALSVRTVCFIESGYTFPSNVDSRSPPFEFSECYDSTKTSEQFQELDPKYVSPGEYLDVNTLHRHVKVVIRKYVLQSTAWPNKRPASVLILRSQVITNLMIVVVI